MKLLDRGRRLCVEIPSTAINPLPGLLEAPADSTVQPAVEELRVSRIVVRGRDDGKRVDDGHRRPCLAS